MSTGGISAPLIFDTSPKCNISGKCCFVTAIDAAKTSAAQTGFMPDISAQRGKPPIPSKRLPSVIRRSILQPPTAAILRRALLYT